MKNKRLYILLGSALVVLILLAVFKGSGDEGLPVEVEKATLRSIVEIVSASGKIEPETEVKISPEVSGEIVELIVSEGDFVEKGQLLVRINPDLYTSALNRTEAAMLSAQSSLANSKARLAQAEAQFTVAKRNWERNQNLHEQGAISDAEFDQAKSTFEVAQSEVKAAEETVKGAQFAVQSSMATRKEAEDNLRRTTIYAPQDGIVNGLVVERGERVVGTGMMGGTELMRISDLGTMQVNVEVNESDIVRVAMGDTAIVEVDAYLGQKFKGVVTEIGNTALNTLSGSIAMGEVTNFSVKIRMLRSSYGELAGQDSLRSPFRPGMSATVDIQTEKAMNVLAIPIKAVTTRLDTAASGYAKYLSKSDSAGESNEPIQCVFVNEGGKAALRAVKTGIQDNKFIVVESGVNEGEEVITGPYEAVARSLSNDQKVEISKAGEEQK